MKLKLMLPVIILFPISGGRIASWHSTKVPVTSVLLPCLLSVDVTTALHRYQR